MSLDLRVFYDINHGPTWPAPIMLFFSEALNHWPGRIGVLAVIVMLLIKGNPYRKAVWQSLLAVGVANPCTDLFKHHLPEPRPFQVLHDVILRVGWSNSAGTASGHSANTSAVAITFCLATGWWGAPWVAVAFLTALSRVYNGAHFPYQVLLGWLCGAFAALLVSNATRLVQKRWAAHKAKSQTPTEAVVE